MSREKYHFLHLQSKDRSFENEEDDNIEIRQKPDNDSSYVEMDLNLSYVPPELQAHLFLKERKALLATSIKYRWLAVSKG